MRHPAVSSNSSWVLFQAISSWRQTSLPIRFHLHHIATVRCELCRIHQDPRATYYKAFLWSLDLSSIHHRLVGGQSQEKKSLHFHFPIQGRKKVPKLIQKPRFRISSGYLLSWSRKDINHSHPHQDAAYELPSKFHPLKKENGNEICYWPLFPKHKFTALSSRKLPDYPY